MLSELYKFLTLTFVNLAFVSMCLSQDTCNTTRYAGYIAFEETSNHTMIDDMIFRGPYLYVYVNGKIEKRKSVFLLDFVDIFKYNKLCALERDSDFLLNFYIASGYADPLQLFNDLRRSLPETCCISNRNDKSFSLYYIDMDVVFVGKSEHVFLRKRRAYTRKQPTYLVSNIRKLEAVPELPK